MLTNFHLAALIKDRDKYELFQIPMHRSLQSTLAKLWDKQLETLTKDVTEIPFTPGYNPDDSERFVIPGFTMPEGLVDMDSSKVHQMETFHSKDVPMEEIKAVVGYARDAKGKELALFQTFNRSHIIRPGRFLLLSNETYVTSEEPGLALGDKLAAKYDRDTKKLLFRSFHLTNIFLPLAEYYSEATEEEIREVLDHELIEPEDADELAVDASQWYRKHFAMLRDSDILNTYSASEIKRKSRGYDVDIKVRDGQIVFPASRSGARRVLKFLTEELFRGAITDTLYETNSKRVAG